MYSKLISDLSLPLRSVLILRLIICNSVLSDILTNPNPSLLIVLQSPSPDQHKDHKDHLQQFILPVLPPIRSHSTPQSPIVPTLSSALMAQSLTDPPQARPVIGYIGYMGTSIIGQVQ